MRTRYVLTLGVAAALAGGCTARVESATQDLRGLCAGVPVCADGTTWSAVECLCDVAPDPSTRPDDVVLAPVFRPGLDPAGAVGDVGGGLDESYFGDVGIPCGSHLCTSSAGCCSPACALCRPPQAECAMVSCAGD